jgi:DNA-binding XRE family transcriptional regulator
MVDANFAGRLKELRAATGLTQQQLAEKAGVALRTVSSLEQGAYDATWPTVRALAQALGVTCMAFDQKPAAVLEPRRGRPPGAGQWTIPRFHGLRLRADGKVDPFYGLRLARLFSEAWSQLPDQVRSELSRWWGGRLDSPRIVIAETLDDGWPEHDPWVASDEAGHRIRFNAKAVASLFVKTPARTRAGLIMALVARGLANALQNARNLEMDESQVYDWCEGWGFDLGGLMQVSTRTDRAGRARR